MDEWTASYILNTAGMPQKITKGIDSVALIYNKKGGLKYDKIRRRIQGN